jgi:arylsulfatase A-like enzyme
MVSGAEQPDLLDWELEQAAEFVTDVCPTSDPAECAGPFFLMYSTWAPHRPAHTPPAYDSLYSEFAYSGRAFNEYIADGLDDKPFYVQASATSLDRGRIRAEARAQLRQLRWLDDNLDSLLEETLSPKGLLTNTIIIFTSDNGYLWGEHGVIRKDRPYEESLRAPLFIYNPLHSAWTPREISQMVAVDLDLAPTILELMGADPMPTDGQSLTGIVEDPANTPWRNALLIQGGYELGYDYPQTWVGVRRADGWKYIEYVTRERELYRLSADPFERFNRYGVPGYEAVMTRMQRELAAFDRPLAITMEGLPDPTRNALPEGTVVAAYEFQFRAGGGTEPYTWALFQRTGDPRCAGGLPEGMILEAAGLLAGTLVEVGMWGFCVQVADSGGGPHVDYRQFEMVVR